MEQDSITLNLGRFISRDPVGYVDGMNLYRAYFVPNRMDPRGLETFEECVENCVHEVLIFHTETYVEDPGKVIAACKKWCRGRPTTPKPTEPTKPTGPVVVEIPKPGEGCTGNCISISGSTVTSIKLTEAKFDGPDCSTALGFASVNTTIKLPFIGEIPSVSDEIKRMLGLKSGISSDTCSEGCSCQDKVVYDGKTVTVNLKSTRIQLDPDLFEEAIRPSGPNCFVTLTGTATIKVGSGWVGTCKKTPKCP